MKKFKKAVVAGLAAAMTMAAVPMINSYAAQAVNNEPKMYLDFTVESDGDIRAEVVIKNMPEFSTCGFHIVLDEGLRFAKSSEGEDMEEIARGTFDYQIIEANVAACTFMRFDDRDCNGHFVAFYVERTEINNPFNSTGKIEFRSTPYLSDMVSNTKGEYIYYPPRGIGSVNTPEMLESNEYLVGDVNGDGIVDGSDATLVLRSSTHHGALNIKNPNVNYNDEIPDIRSAYAADVNNDGFVSLEDSTLILRYYTTIISDKAYDGNIGSVDIYEIYND